MHKFNSNTFRGFIFLLVCCFISILFLSQFVTEIAFGFIISNSKIIKLKSECNCRKEDSILLTKNDLENTFNVFSTLDKSTYNVNYTELYSITCGLYQTLRHKRNQKVIGMSLYGKNKLYSKYLEGYLL